jgi:hypothetical protein
MNFQEMGPTWLFSSGRPPVDAAPMEGNEFERRMTPGQATDAGRRDRLA